MTRFVLMFLAAVSLGGCAGQVGFGPPPVAVGYQAPAEEVDWASCDGMCRAQVAREICPDAPAISPQEANDPRLLSLSRDEFEERVAAGCATLARHPGSAYAGRQAAWQHGGEIGEHQGRPYCAPLGSRAFLVANPRPRGPGWEMTPVVPGKPCGGWRHRREV